MGKLKKFSVDTDLAVQVDKLSKGLEESKAREEQLSKLADGMIQVISNYQLEVSKKDAEIEELRKQLNEAEHQTQLLNISEVTSSGITGILSSNETSNNWETVSSPQDSKMQICLQRIRSLALSNKTLASLLNTENLPAIIRCRLSWFYRPTPEPILMTIKKSERILGLTTRLLPVKRWFYDDAQIMDELNLLEKAVFDIMRSVFGQTFTIRKVNSVMEPPFKKRKIASTAVSGKYVSDELLEEMSSIVNRDVTFTKLLKRGNDLPNNVLEAIDWLRTPMRYKATPEHMPENVIRTICDKFFILQTCLREEDKTKILVCRNRVTSRMKKVSAKNCKNI
ncbi:hypothetical protein HDE_12244 [Halotydeus destructor]|nr:hypothetical protein HDE_12244 [Halotydeus destructor]